MQIDAKHISNTLPVSESPLSQIQKSVNKMIRIFVKIITVLKYTSSCSTDCESCLIDGVNKNRLNAEEFMRYLQWFLTSNPDTTACNQG